MYIKPSVAQGALPFQYETEKTQSNYTGLAGLPSYLELSVVSGLADSINENLHTKVQGWTDLQELMALIMLHLAGGEHVEDLNILQADDGFCRLMRKVETHGLPRAARRKLEKRWRKERHRSVPSPSSAFRFLESFHDASQEKLRRPGVAFIPAPNIHLQALPLINSALVGFAQKRRPETVGTLDMDATLIGTSKQEALPCYKGYPSYQPINTYWVEQDLVLHTEFRDGNVPAGFQQLRVFKEALDLLPEGVETVRLRSDTAGYQHDLLRYCEMGENERFGRIEFAIACDVTPEFKEAVKEVPRKEWHKIYEKKKGKLVESAREWAEVCYVPNAIGHSLNGPVYRYLAIRESLKQAVLPGMESQMKLPFPTMEMEGQHYKVFGLVTNMDWEGEGLIHWSNKRCGKCEEANGVLKNDLAGGKLPSGKFGANAAWWWISVMAANLNAIMKRLVLGGSWVNKRLKAIRFWLINIPGRVMERSRQLFIRITAGHPAFDLLLMIRRKLAEWAAMPPG
ncbi:MAG: IS1380 family transposase [Deltaproteobacteria bacterium]|nr:IS1380 family transposase [Deltaproteobacteria bacterium]